MTPETQLNAGLSDETVIVWLISSRQDDQAFIGTGLGPGYRLSTFPSLPDALAQPLHSAQDGQQPELVLLRPDTSDAEVLSALQAATATRGRPVLRLMDAADPDLLARQQAALALGVSDIITLPCSPALLRSRVRSQIQWRRMTDIGTALMADPDVNHLLQRILGVCQGITAADGGTLYLMSEDRRHLNFCLLRNDTLGVRYGGSQGQPLPATFKPLPLYQADGSANVHMVAAYAALTGQTVNIADAYLDQDFDFSGTRAFDRSTGYRSQSFLTVPLRDHEGDIMGVLQLINAKDRDDGRVIPFRQADQLLVESLSTQAAIAMTNRQLIQQLEGLFEGFIQLIGTAIDDKSPYTGGHCQRVPELTMLLAEAADRTNQGPLADFKLSDKDRRELRIAALLHDCGKIVTPVHVVDKATKLETLFDRIALVRQRFEVIARDAEIQHLRAVAAGADAADSERILAEKVQAIRDDCAFLERANKGAERMADEDIARIQAIAQRYRWTDLDGEAQAFLTGDELRNLSIRAGTLTPEEREIINHHIVATIQMLEKMPWPRHLRNVPEYAGGHHERMDGKGYPKGLTREQMSVQARMMGIADIFEALTAPDRPYKAPMNLSLALKILQNFRDNGHIDPDLHDVFLQEGVAHAYAARFLAPNQIDV